MKRLVWLLWLPILLVACAEDDEVDAGVLSLSFYESSALSGDYPYVSEGDGLVLHRYFMAQDEPNIADDEYSEDFLVELPATTGDEFLLEGDDLLNLNVLYNQYCFCLSGDIIQITGGEISGSRVAQGWLIEVDISYEQSYRNPQDGEIVVVDVDSISFSGIFRERPRP